MYNLLSTSAIKGILACGLTLVIVTGGIDISVGANLAFGGILTAALLGGTTSTTSIFANIESLPVPLAISISIIACTCVGLINGIVINLFRVPPFIATMGMMQITRGLAYICSGGFAISFADEISTFRWIGTGKIGVFPTIAAFLIIIAFLFWWLLKFTKYGRYLCAIGTNETASRYSGINIDQIRISTYALMGGLAGLCGVILTARLNSAPPDAGMSYELDAITAVVVGGTSLSGGKGTMLGTLAGTLIMVVLSNGLNLLGVQSIYQYLSKGLVLLIAVVIDSYVSNKSGR